MDNNNNKKLIILDMNGAMLYRRTAQAGFTARPNLIPFLEEASKHFTLGVWTSATRPNAIKALESVLPKHLLQPITSTMFLTREDCTYAPTEQNRHRTIKDLHHVWSEPEKFGGRAWGPENTLLIDDSLDKASRQPDNALIVPTFERVHKDTDTLYAQLLPFLLNVVVPATDVRKVVEKWHPAPPPSVEREMGRATPPPARPRDWWPAPDDCSPVSVCSPAAPEIKPLSQKEGEEAEEEEGKAATIEKSADSDNNNNKSSCCQLPRLLMLKSCEGASALASLSML
eukprot:PhM_4_TR5595/c1_g1_i2/m.86088